MSYSNYFVKHDYYKGILKKESVFESKLNKDPKVFIVIGTSQNFDSYERFLYRRVLPQNRLKCL